MLLIRCHHYFNQAIMIKREGVQQISHHVYTTNLMNTRIRIIFFMRCNSCLNFKPIKTILNIIISLLGIGKRTTKRNEKKFN